MDSIINKGKSMLNKQTGTQGQSGLDSGMNAGQATSGGNEDYVDKGVYTVYFITAATRLIHV